jgi:hypothetical protein
MTRLLGIGQAGESRCRNGLADAQAARAARMMIARAGTAPLDRYIHLHLYS